MELKHLENRITELERIYGITDETPLPDQSFADQIYNLQVQLLEQNHKVDKELNANLLKLIQFHNSSYAQKHLTPQEKTMVIQELSKDFDKDSQYLSNILKLSKHLDFQPILNLQEKQGELQMLHTQSKLNYNLDQGKLVLEESSKDLLKTVVEQTVKETEELVELNQQVVDGINQKMLYYEKVLNNKNR